MSLCRFFMTENMSIEERFENLKRYMGPIFHKKPKIPYTKV